MRRLLPLLLAGCAATPPCEVVHEAAARGGEPRNVMIVILDDVGVDQLGAWELTDDVAATPTVDCLCEVGTRFTQAWSSPMCSPTRAEIQTGRYNRRTGIGDILAQDRPSYELPLEEETLAEVAARAGMRSALVGKWHLVSDGRPDAATHPNRSGYDHFAGALANLSAVPEGRHGPLDYDRWVKVEDGRERISHTYATTDTIDEAIDFVRHTDEPWLLVVSFSAPHVPLHAPPGRLLDERVSEDDDEVTLYRAMLSAADHELGRLFSKLGPDVLADTTIALLGDNGSPKEAIVPPFVGEGSKGTMTEAGVRVPLVFTGPTVAQGASTDALAHVVDLLPTMAALVDVAPEAPVLDGASLLDVLADPTAPGPHATIASFRFPDVGSLDPDPTSMNRALRNEGYKLEILGRERRMFEVRPGAIDEGPDLLADGTSPEEEEQLDLLWAAMGALESTFGPEQPGAR
ncbi:MAG: sulfatase-like hydrolase/transferase [Alphaproteobacteria bacterium]|nr:sulfatase-like hydrolase/transferase [Alphaproteobacteria bacterium]MCB9698078.1 sulfatase-like hydrolase/transferase [Alphaproteobacteria bacterium]